MTNLTKPADSTSTSGQALWITSLLSAIIVLAHVFTYLYATILSEPGIVATVDWTGMGIAVAIIQGIGGVPYIAKHATFKHPPA